MKAYHVVLAALPVLAFVAGALWGHRSAPVAPGTPTVRTDTLVIRDTVVRERPVAVYREVVRHDTVLLRSVAYDTVRTIVPIERKVYMESDLYYAVVSGYEPALEKIIVYPKTILVTTEVTRTKEAPRWGIGITAGPSALVTPSGSLHGGIGVTAGVTYRF